MSELYHPRHLSPALWSIAGIVAIALHAGGVGLAFVSKQPDSEPDLGAPAIEIGIELAAPKLEPTDLPVGPDTEAAAPSPAHGRAESRDRADRFAEGDADRDRRSGSGRVAERN